MRRSHEFLASARVSTDRNSLCRSRREGASGARQVQVQARGRHGKREVWRDDQGRSDPPRFVGGEREGVGNRGLQVRCSQLSFIKTPGSPATVTLTFNLCLIYTTCPLFCPLGSHVFLFSTKCRCSFLQASIMESSTTKPTLEIAKDTPQSPSSPLQLDHDNHSPSIEDNDEEDDQEEVEDNTRHSHSPSPSSSNMSAYLYYQNHPTQASPPPVIVHSKAAKKRKSWGQELPEPKTKLPPRKRAKTDDEKEQRRIERIKRNRAAAHNSRERKRQEAENLAVLLAKANAELEAYRKLHGPLPSHIVLPEVTVRMEEYAEPFQIYHLCVTNYLIGNLLLHHPLLNLMVVWIRLLALHPSFQVAIDVSPTSRFRSSRNLWITPSLPLPWLPLTLRMLN